MQNPPRREDLATLALAVALAAAILTSDAWRRQLLHDIEEHALGENTHPDDLATPGRW